MQGVVASPGSELAGRYTLERELGRGGTATVYLATDARHRRRVAVKILRSDVAAALGRERFLREIEIAARLSHPHILPLHDSGESDGLVFYVMPYVEGESLRERLRREGPLPIDDALRIAREVADALAFAHRSGVVHRDIKPGNILLHAGHAVVADFGIARAISEATGDEITSQGMIVGTPTYLSPEQATHGPVDARTDIYAVGCVLHEMLAGEAPFTGRTPQAMVACHLHQLPTPLRTIRPSVPAAVEAAVLVALEKRPADRFADAEAFAAALGGEGPVVPRRRALLRRAGLGAAVALAAGVGIWRWTRDTAVLDPNRVLVLPIAGPGPDSAGQRDAATLALIASLNSTSSIVGLDGARIGSPRPLAPARARRLARAQRAAFLVDANLLRADSLRLLLNVEDLRDGSLVHYVVGFPPRVDAWAIGVRAALELLPTVLRTSRPAELPSLTGRSPAAMAEYFLGEGAYRRAAFTEALPHFRRAVELDSAFALAALRGAQAANWHHETAETDALVRVALANLQSLPPRFQELTRGLDDYVRGRGDSAVLRFRRAIALDPSAAEPWMWLGETYNHLIPQHSPLDSLAEQSYRTVRELDSTFAPVLFHLIEFAARRGDRAETARLLRAYRHGNPDPELLGSLELVAGCVADSLPPGAWPAAARRTPARVFAAGHILALGGLRQPVCARAAFEALVAGDTTGSEARAPYRFGSLVALHGILVATGDRPALRRLLDGDTGFNPEYRGQLYLLAALVDSSFTAEAETYARQLRARYAADPAAVPSRQLWFLGSWDWRRDRGAEAEALAGRLLDRAGGAEARLDSLLGLSLLARATLAQGDTGAALRRLRDLAPTTASDQELTWNPWESLGGERLILAQLLLARNRPGDALQVAANFDSPVPVSYLMYVPASLALRIEAATRLGESRLAGTASDRLARLRGSSGMHAPFTRRPDGHRTGPAGQNH